MSKQKSIREYKSGDDGVYADDLNLIEQRLARLEKLTVQAPLEMTDSPSGQSISLNKNIIEWGFFTLVEDMPPHGVARATLTLFDPDSEDDYDYDSLSTLSGAFVSREENGTVRGRRDTYQVIVHDMFGIPGWPTDKVVCFRHPYSHDGRWFVLPNFVGEQWFGTLEISDAHPTIATDPGGTPDYDDNKQYAKFREKFTSCTTNAGSSGGSFRETIDNPATVGGSVGDGWWIKCIRRGIYHVIVNLQAERTSTPSVGGTFEARSSAASFLNIYLQYKCSNSWITVDQGVLDALPHSGRGGAITLQAKLQTCFDNDGFRVVVQVSNNTPNTGDWRINSGSMHIQRCHHQHMTALGRNWSLQADGDQDTNIMDEEGGYIEPSEELVLGEYDQNWLPADGNDPKKYNSGYPTGTGPFP